MKSVSVWGLALVAGCCSSAMAGTILVNPTAGDITGSVSISSTAASAKMKFSNTNWDMSISPKTSTDNVGGATFLQRQITNNTGDLTSAWTFLVSYQAGQGYTFNMSRVGSPPLSGTLTWRADAAQNLAGGTANTLNTSTGNSVSATRSFNFIRMHARASSGTMSFSNLQFNGDGTGLIAGSVNTSSGARSSIDGSGGAGFAYQDILSDMDLSLQNWTLSGTIQSTVATNSEGVRFEMDMFNASGYSLNSVPLPPAAWAGLSTLVGGWPGAHPAPQATRLIKAADPRRSLGVSRAGGASKPGYFRNSAIGRSFFACAERSGRPPPATYTPPITRKSHEPRRSRSFTRPAAFALLAVIAILQLASIPFYAGSSLGSFASWRLEHGRITLTRNDTLNAEPFYIAINSEGLRWSFEGRRYSANHWFVTIPLWFPILLTAAWAWSNRRRRCSRDACTACGYPLVDLKPNSLCPECGRSSSAKNS